MKEKNDQAKMIEISDSNYEEESIAEVRLNMNAFDTQQSEETFTAYGEDSQGNYSKIINTSSQIKASNYQEGFSEF